MATDATGTPTSPDNIPTYNTSVDAPSGLGFNAAMAAVQTALSARTTKPAGIVSGEAAVWNGTTWDRSSVTKIGAASLTGLSTLDNTYTISAANTDFAFSSNAPQSLLGVTPTGTAGTLRSLGAGAFEGQLVRIRCLGAGGGRFVVRSGLAGGSGKQFSLFADRPMMPGDVLTLQWMGSLFSGAGGWYEVVFNELNSVGQYAGNTTQVNGTWTDLTGMASVESLFDPPGNLSLSGGVVTIAKSGTYAISLTVSYATPGTAAAASILLGGTQYATTTLYATFGVTTCHLTQTVGPPGTTIKGQSWTNGGAQSLFSRMTVRYLGAS